MPKKLIYEEVKEFVESLGFILISGTYVNTKTKIILKDKEGFLYGTRLHGLLMSKIPHRFHKANPYTIYNINWWLKFNLSELELITEEYLNSNKQKFILKDIEGYLYSTILDSLVNMNKHPRKFHNSNPYTIQNINLWCKLNNKPFRLINDKYKNSDIDLQWQCLKPECGEIFEMPWGDILQGHGCGVCRGMQVGISNCLAINNPELSKEFHPTKNNGLTAFDFTYGSGKSVWWKCKECGNEWEAQISNRNNENGSGCLKCNESKGEKRCREVLQKLNIPYDSQYIFNDLLSDLGNSLRFDFAVFLDKEKISLNLLIEFDGKQHFKWIKGWQTKHEFKTLQYHDKLKDKYCKKHNIKLLRITYKDFNNIEEIINNELLINQESQLRDSFLYI